MGSLPSFKHPPVTEVALAVQFDPMEALTGAHMGLLWQRFRDRFPRIEFHHPRSPAFESDRPARPGPSVEVRAVDVPTPPRTWFISGDGTEVIQIQQDRFVFNWRRRDGEYPRYERVREAFTSHLNRFLAFLDEETMKPPEYNQWEVSYVNEIHPSEEWSSYADLGAIIPSWSHAQSDDFLPDPEGVALRIRYRLPLPEEEVGRLHVVVEPRFGTAEDRPTLHLRLTARGTPRQGRTTDQMLEYLDVGREWIVRGFASITSETMHARWGRER